MRLLKKDTILSSLNSALITYPAPSNLSYMWNFGFYSALCLVIQVITGIFLAMHYTPEAGLALSSVEHIMRDVNYGWLFRYLHANGASIFFISVYVHMFRGLYYGSYLFPRQLLWIIGVVILFLMIATAFLGYVLPWGQMSFWGATVITNLVSAIPIVGDHIVIWLWGGYSVDNATLNRFFSLHYLLPFLILALVFVHIVYLHDEGSNNPLGIRIKFDRVSFYPYYLVKDFYGFICFLFLFSFFVFFFPNFLGHPDNYIGANSLVTPTHIVPEWYFLPFYAILRSIPDKLGGVLAMAFSIVIFALLPYFAPSRVRSSLFRPLSQIFFFIFLAVSLLLGWLGSQPAETPYVEVARLASLVYFLYFILLMPFEVYLNNFFWNSVFRFRKFLNR